MGTTDSFKFWSNSTLFQFSEGIFLLLAWNNSAGIWSVPGYFYVFSFPVSMWTLEAMGWSTSVSAVRTSDCVTSLTSKIVIFLEWNLIASQMKSHPQLLVIFCLVWKHLVTTFRVAAPDGSCNILCCGAWFTLLWGFYGQSNFSDFLKF